MLKRGYGQLAIYEIKDNLETVPLKIIEELIEEKGADIVYITQYAKLYGIICLNEVLHATGEMVSINREFCCVECFDVVRAHKLFTEKKNIHKIPIVDEQGKLVADYNRWEDKPFVERNRIYCMQNQMAKKYLDSYETVYVVKPAVQANVLFEDLLQCLKIIGISYIVRTKRQIEITSLRKNLYIFLSRDELRAAECLMRVVFSIDETKKKTCYMTYDELLINIIQAEALGQISEGKKEKINEKASILLGELRKSGIKSLCINGEVFTGTDYAKRIRNEIHEKVKKLPDEMDFSWKKEAVSAEFLNELYQLEDYKNGVVQKELEIAWGTYREHDVKGRYCNSNKGKRITLYQPSQYSGTIYFLGPCTFFGYHCEDQYTIESYLQKKLLEEGYWYRVENYASPISCSDSEIEVRLMEIKKFHENDIIVYLSRGGDIVGVENRTLWDICEEQNIPSEWMTNSPMHINYKASQLVADSIFKMLTGSFLRKENKDEQKKEVQVDIDMIMKKYVYRKYLKRYFDTFSGDRYDTVGAIVMNCNPFSKGHRHLIEYACQRVDFLIIFVVEENVSLFSFEERYAMVREGTKDLKNVKVVPSGEFILSCNNFCEYFNKNDTGVTELSAQYDINMFAEYIAKPLHITYRFAGEEPFDTMTSIYNQVMKKVLPQKGIQFIQIPRMKVDGNVVSATSVRRYLEYGQYEKAFKLLPETTIQCL